MLKLNQKDKSFNKNTNVYHIKCSRKVKKTKASGLSKTQSPMYEIKYEVVQLQLNKISCYQTHKDLISDFNSKDQ
jgi:hypothetical protein